MSSQVQTVIGVPGCWSDRSDIVQSIVRRSAGYIFAGKVLMKIGAKDGFTLDIEGHNPDMRQAFAAAGGLRFTEEELAAIDAHTFTLYLVADGGSIEAAKKCLHAANALLKCGGLAVKIESTGVAHTAGGWAGFCERDDLGGLLRAYVTYIGDPGVFYSCGMHNLGCPDALVEADIEPNDAANLLYTFLGFLLVDHPTLKDGETFSVAEDAPHYRLFHEPCTRYPEGDLFHNPFGQWKLGPA